jgi:hypothetical protein
MGFGTNLKPPVPPIHRTESFLRLPLKWEQQAETRSLIEILEFAFPASRMSQIDR